MSGGPSVLAGQRCTAGTYNENVAGPWTALTLENSWANYSSGYVAAQYRLRDTVTCEVIGVIRAGTVTNGTVVFTLPSGYYNPNNQQGLLLSSWTNTAPSFAWLQCMTNGACEIEGSAVASTIYMLHGLISLDA